MPGPVDGEEWIFVISAQRRIINPPTVICQSCGGVARYDDDQIGKFGTVIQHYDYDLDRTVDYVRKWIEENQTKPKEES